MFTSKTKKSKPKIPTKARLRNIALYYLKRFESSEDSLRAVLKRRIDKYAFFEYKKTFRIFTPTKCLIYIRKGYEKSF